MAQTPPPPQHKDLGLKEFHRLLLMAPSDAILPLSAKPLFMKPEFPNITASCTTIVSRGESWSVLSFGAGSCTVSQMLDVVRELLADPLVDSDNALVSAPCAADGTRRIVDAASWKLTVHCSFEVPVTRWLYQTHLNPHCRLSDDNLVAMLNGATTEHDKHTAGEALVRICGEHRVQRYCSKTSVDHVLILRPDGKWSTLSALLSEHALHDGSDVLACLDLACVPTGHAVATFKEGVTLEALRATFSDGADPAAIVRAVAKCLPVSIP